jgi:hypothetical protein
MTTPGEMRRSTDTLSDVLRVAARGAGAARHADITVPYADLVDRAAAVDQALVARSVPPDALCMANGAPLLAAMAAVVSRGGAYLHVDPEWPASMEPVGCLYNDRLAPSTSTLTGRSRRPSAPLSARYSGRSATPRVRSLIWSRRFPMWVPASPPDRAASSTSPTSGRTTRGLAPGATRSRRPCPGGISRRGSASGDGPRRRDFRRVWNGCSWRSSPAPAEHG